MSETKVIYSAIFLTEDATKALFEEFQPRHPKVFGHHVTLIFKPNKEALSVLEPYLGIEVSVLVNGEAFDKRGHCVKCVVPPYLRLGSQVHHITISCADDVTPIYSNELLKEGFKPTPSLMLRGIVRHFTK